MTKELREKHFRCELCSTALECDCKERSWQYNQAVSDLNKKIDKELKKSDD